MDTNDQNQQTTTQQQQYSQDDFYINKIGSTFYEPYVLITLWPISRLLWCCLKLYMLRFFKRAPMTLEFLVLFTPFILAVTLLQAHVYYLVAALSFVTLVLLLRLLISGEPLLRLVADKKVSNALETRGLLASLLATLMLSVAVCILAVDFPIFPRRGAKTYDYGFSIMDSGVGAFIAFSGAVSPEGKHAAERSTDRTMLTKLDLITRTLCSSVPLIILSFLRISLIRYFEYREITEEYGTHLNFFAVLAAVKLISCLIYCIIGRKLKLNYVGVGVIVAYQAFINLYANEHILKAESRSNFFMANKEGFLSIIGLTGYHLVYTRLQLIIDAAARTHKRYGITQTLKALLRLALPAIVGLVIFHNFVQPSSRRISNAAYICWSALQVLYLLGCEVTVNSCIAGLQKRYYNVEDFGSSIYASFACNAMPLFLLANVLTGGINFFLEASTLTLLHSLSILFIYVLILSIVAHYLYRNNYDIRSATIMSLFGKNVPKSPQKLSPAKKD